MATARHAGPEPPSYPKTAESPRLGNPGRVAATRRPMVIRLAPHYSEIRACGRAPCLGGILSKSKSRKAARETDRPGHPSEPRGSSVDGVSRDFLQHLWRFRTQFREACDADKI